MPPLTLLILDGWGYTAETKGNAIRAAKTPHYNELLAKFPNSLLHASGEHVGLPPGLMGNSEVGHLTIGAGRVVIHKLTLISRTIADGTFFKNPVLVHAIESASQQRKALHVLGLVSDGCVHSSPDHLDGLLELAKRNKVELIVHPILDGRDTPPRSALRFMRELQQKLEGIGKIGVVCGRYYAMDRDSRWERVEKYWRALVLGQGSKVESAVNAVEHSYDQNVGDEFVLPAIVTERPILDGDSVVCFNFRPDRVRQISRALTQEVFDGFDRPVNPKIFYACMTEYDQKLNLPIAFNPSELPIQDVSNSLPSFLSCHHLDQLHTAETEKYAHVTYFLNGGSETVCDGEERTLVPSLKIATYDLEPRMQTPKVCQIACEAILSGKYPFVVLNFANPDMVGHTGMMDAAVTAVESVDQAFAEMLQATSEAKGTLVVTADHGNVEQMIDYKTGEPHTAHTTNLVPLIVADFSARKIKSLGNGGLADVAPTVLELMGLSKPSEMTGSSRLLGELAKTI